MSHPRSLVSVRDGVAATVCSWIFVLLAVPGWLRRRHDQRSGGCRPDLVEARSGQPRRGGRGTGDLATQPGLPLLSSRGADHEPADECEPYPTQSRTSHDLHNPSAISTKPRILPARAAFTAAVCRSPRHRHKAARNTRPPSSGAAGMRLNTASIALVAARYASTPRGNPVAPSNPSPAGGEAEPDGQAQTGQGAHDGDPKVRPRSSRLTPELGDAAEEPQHDALDLDAVAAGHQRMCQLVSQQRGQEQHRGDDRGDHVGGDAAVRKRRRAAGRSSAHPPRSPR